MKAVWAEVGANMIQIEHERDRNLLTLRVSGMLTVHDYKVAVPEIENAIDLSESPLSILIRLEDFRGWTIGGLWKELSFDISHRGAFGRIAVVGEPGLQEWVTKLSAPFFDAKVRFFPFSQKDAARRWLSDG